jgi:Uncharacterized alpha/beta hydrolase domain (DUF2235)
MERNLIVACDGTNNSFGACNTNVVRLIQALEHDSGQQLIYYDPGVGTLPDPGFVTRSGQKLSEIWGLAFGAGMLRKIGVAYEFLMEHWRPGDRVYLIGFSRGAYTVRALASLLHMYGLLPRGNRNLLPYLLRMFRASRAKLDEGSRSAEAFWQLCDDFRETFAQAVPGIESRRFPIHFVGVWDTVSSVGWVWDPLKFPFTKRNPSIRIARHAVALDERRSFYRQNLFAKVPGQDLRELWFPGVHADVGGGYPEAEGGLWREPYAWIVDEAVRAGLRIDPAAHANVLTRYAVPAAPWREPAHDSLRWYWWPAEFFPKLKRGWLGWRWPSLNLGRARAVRNGALLHASIVNRLRDLGAEYEARALSKAFRQAALGEDVPREQTVYRYSSSGTLLVPHAPVTVRVQRLHSAMPPVFRAPRRKRSAAGPFRFLARFAQQARSRDARSRQQVPMALPPASAPSVGASQPPTAVADTPAPYLAEEVLDEGEPRYLQAGLREPGAAGRRERVTTPLTPDREYRVEVRVGLKSDDYLDLGVPAPVPAFEEDRPHEMQVFFHDLGRGTVRSDRIWLPVRGNSTTCEFAFTAPSEGDEFRARIVLCHRGRVLQAGQLQAPVGRTHPSQEPRFECDVITPILAAESANVPAFDTTIFIDRRADGDTVGLVSAGDAASNPSSNATLHVTQATLNAVIQGITGALRKYANTPPDTIAIDSPEILTLLRKLAIHGSGLYEEVVKPSQLLSQRPPGWRLSIACAAESYFPAEFVYQEAVPAADAGLCAEYRQALKSGKCCGECQRRGGDVICLLGFWGLSCVIERKCGAAATQSGSELLPNQFEVMYRAARLEDGLQIGSVALLATSEVVSKLDTQAAATLSAGLKEIYHDRADDAVNWKQWVDRVAASQPNVLVLLPHHVRDESSLEYLQIGAEAKEEFLGHPNYLNSRHVTSQHVLGPNGSSPPLVLLIGCETTQARVPFENFVVAFDRAGAASVVGTTAPIAGRHAGRAVRLLVETLRAAGSADRALGDVLLEAKRDILLDGYPMIMGLATYSGVDHRIQA